MKIFNLIFPIIALYSVAISLGDTDLVYQASGEQIYVERGSSLLASQSQLEIVEKEGEDEKDSIPLRDKQYFKEKIYFVPTSKAERIVIEEEEEPDPQLEAIRAFTKRYRGSRIDGEYFELLEQYCSIEGLRTVVAISVAESGMGRDTPFRHSNFWGWFANGNRNYDPDRETMSRVICSGIERNYIGIGHDFNKAYRYVGHNPTNWLSNFNWAYYQMEVY